ncbi:hypothetical protein KFK09_003897 [Dendrobium nobile]|uniref:Uncharacterized protein n=1 Tax=Dendrobium nobile TaxID=94219 RepID=A0A8T3C1D9_DENNO|nr:hypothetical protein KFK09_003897 [Dendrobium nobile]
MFNHSITLYSIKIQSTSIHQILNQSITLQVIQSILQLSNLQSSGQHSINIQSYIQRSVNF